jgi:hypothetical protein
MDELERLRGEQLLARVTVQAAEGGVRVHDSSVRRAQGETIDRTVENGVILLLARA